VTREQSCTCVLRDTDADRAPLAGKQLARTSLLWTLWTLDTSLALTLRDTHRHRCLQASIRSKQMRKVDATLWRAPTIRSLPDSALAAQQRVPLRGVLSYEREGSTT
jgi:hypothetical protein